MAWRVNYGSWEKAPRLSRETGGHETPARSPTFRLTAGLTAGSDAPEQSLPPPVHATLSPLSGPRLRARQPPTFRPPPSALQLPPAAPAHPPTLLSLSPCFIVLTSRHPFPTKAPFLNPRRNAAANRADRCTPSVVCPRDPTTRKS